MNSTLQPPPSYWLHNVWREGRRLSCATSAAADGSPGSKNETNLTYLTVCRKGGSTDSCVVEDWKKPTLALLRREYGTDDIQKLGEAALFFLQDASNKNIPNKAYRHHTTERAERRHHFHVWRWHIRWIQAATPCLWTTRGSWMLKKYTASTMVWTRVPTQ